MNVSQTESQRNENTCIQVVLEIIKLSLVYEVRSQSAVFSNLWNENEIDVNSCLERSVIKKSFSFFVLNLKTQKEKINHFPHKSKNKQNRPD